MVANLKTSETMRVALDTPIFGVTISDWLHAVAVFLVVVFGVPVIRAVIRRRWPIDDHSARSVGALIGRLNAAWMRFTTLSVGVLLAALLLASSQSVVHGLRVALIAVVTFQFIRLAPVVVDWSLQRMVPRDAKDDDERNAQAMVPGVRWLVLFVVYAFILLAALQNMGVNVTSLIAGLGIGGIAVALALQNVLSDLFASLTISLDKPFVVGDFIVVGSEMGSVEHIGLKTTRVRSLSGEQLVFGNSDVLASRVRNFKRMIDRRVVFGFGVVYDTAPDTLERINQIVRSAIDAIPDVRFDRCHLHRIGPSSLDFEAVYYVNSPDYNTHMDAQQAIHLSIVRAFRNDNIEFAFPTQTLHLVRSEHQSRLGESHTKSS